MKNQKVKAFTLVELIVVITILAILGTIAFINLQGYSTGARDSKRLSDINNIQKKISIETSKGTPLSSLIKLVKTNTGLKIDGNNTATSIQGIANFQNLKENGENFKDPVTKGDYVLSYSVGGAGTGAYKFVQISTINEEVNQAVVKGNYYIMQTGDSPSITVNSSDYYVVDQGVDLPYEVTNNIVTLNTNRYPGCDTDNITVGSYTISACNIGATIAGTGLISYGEYFQWGRNKGFAYLDTSQQSSQIDGSIGLDASTDNYGFLWHQDLLSPYTWSTTDIKNNWGDTTDTPLGTNISARQGPCASGYHVPSQQEWDGIITAGGWLDGATLQSSLKLPYAGNRNWDNGDFNDVGNNGHYWTSTPTDSDAFYVLFASSFYNTGRKDFANGLTVRCFKN
ncbi:MAG: prepilin-type N-terminal cleavage/methylation domain-containing protein [Candidatus Gracilibacteria bacterium]|nr:prepilin-type N-terminal cleavage/methylation domain-containing protein [Candidatus Gracilibacteria bacterium]